MVKKNSINFFSIILISLVLMSSCKTDSKKRFHNKTEVTTLEKKIVKNDNSEKEIKRILQAFYTEYINGVEYKDRNEVDVIKNKYLTKNILDKIRLSELDYDPIVNAQDVNIKWLESIKIEKEKEKYKVCFFDDFDNKYFCIVISVIKTKNTYKIDDIEGVKASKPTTNFNLYKTWVYSKESSYAGIAITDNNNILFAVMSSQIYINSKIIKDTSNENTFNLFLVKPDDLGPGGMKLDWDNFSKTKVIAKLKLIKENELELNWLGFYNKKTKKRDFPKCEFNLLSKSNPVLLIYE